MGRVMSVNVYGARVRQARVLRRMTSAAVLGEMGWKGARQTRLEQAEVTEMADEDFARMVSVLGFPEQFFTTSAGSRVSASDLLFRAPKATTLMEKEYLAQFSAVVGDYLDDLDDRHRLPQVSLPAKVSRASGVALAAAQARESLGMAADQPISYLTHDLERAGIVVVVRADRTPAGEQWQADRAETLPDRHLGYSCWTGMFSDRPLIVLRKMDSWERVRWTLAHELGHLLLHSGDVTEGMEEEANRFAGEFLAPHEAIAGELPTHLTLHNLLDLKLKWGISIGALVMHLHSSGLLGEQRFQMLRRQLYTRKNPATGTTWGRMEPGWEEREPERPRLLSRWTDRSFGTAHPGMLASMGLLMLPRDVLEEMLLEQRQAPSPAVAAQAAVRPATPVRPASVIDFAQARAAKRA
jgi:Zn-dependent peptidase ImmA (M78 family)